LWALFFYFRQQDRLFLAGVALALGIFKPTLVALPITMLIVGRRWRIVQGFATGAAAVASLSIGLVGLSGCRGWIDTLLSNSKVAAGPGEAWHLAKLVDMSSFFHLLLFNASPWTTIVLAMAGILAVAFLASAWSRSRSWDSMPQAENGLWAATLCLTLVVNSYAPIYDTILVVIAAALAAQALTGQGTEDNAVFRGWLLLLYMGAWFTQSMAQYLHFQILTLVLAGFGVWSLKMAQRMGLLTSPLPPIDLLDSDAICMPSKKVLLPRS
jgi:hypothetical protein